MIRRATGTGAAATVVLALLVLGCVFVAVAGPRESLATQTQALRKTFAGGSPLASSVVATSNWNQFTADLQGEFFVSNQQTAFVTSQQLGEVTTQLRGDLAGDGVPAAPASADWAGLTPATVPLVSGAKQGPAYLDRQPAKLEVLYREPFTRYTSLIAGHYPGTGMGSTIEVAVSEQTAARLGVHPGSRLRIFGNAGVVTLVVTGIVRPRFPHSTFWTSDPPAAAPDHVAPFRGPAYWVIAAFAGTGAAGQVQQVFNATTITMQWQIPVSVSGVSANQVQALYAALNRAANQTPRLSGDVAAVAGDLTITTGMLTPLATFIATQSAVSDVAWLLFASLTVIAAAVLLLAARMLAVRRAAEFTLMRARGASVRQIAALTLRGCAIACVPAAAAGAALAIVLVPHAWPAAAWWLAGITVLAALAGPAAIAGWRCRLRRRPAGPRRATRRRLVAEAALCAAAIGGVIVFRSQQAAAGTGGINLYTAVAPVLIAIPAVVIIARLYPLALRVLLRMFGRRAGATGFVGLARAARTSLTPTLPAFALVLALTLAAFAGMVRDAITRGEIAASWQVAGADAVIQAGGTGPVVTPAAQRAIGAVPGVRKTASAWLMSWTLPDNQQVTGVAVDPASYAALVATTQTWPQIPAAELALPAGTGAQPVPVLASPSVAASLGGGGTMTTQSGLRPLRVRVAGVLSSTPAVPGNTAFFIVPLTAIHGDLGPVLPLNLMLVTGSGINASALTAVAQRAIPGSLTTTRSAALSALSGAPLQHGTYLIFALTIAAAAGLGLVVMVLELALEASDRELTLARMATMGLASRQRIWLTLVEVLPALLAAAVAATGCALALPRLLGPALDLSVFTGSGAPVRVAPDFTSFVLPLAGLALLAAAALAIETRAQQRRGIAAQLRGGG
jgi:putative ABC transport system permease protein